MVKTVMEAPQLEGLQPWGLYELTRLVGITRIFAVSDKYAPPGGKTH